MSYMALYRKWRPDAFEEIKGQEHIVTTIRNQIVHDRVGHAYCSAEPEVPVRQRRRS